MQATFVIHNDHRGWNLRDGKCAASVIGTNRMKQCSRNATSKGTVHSYDGTTTGVDVFYVPMCSQHSNARNVNTGVPAVTLA